MNSISRGTLVSTRIRLARNLQGYPFPSHLKDEKQAKEIIRLVSSALNKYGDFVLSYMDGISAGEADSLKENHLISPALLVRKSRSAVLISADSGISVMINEEDHLREQCIVKGLHLSEAYNKLSAIDAKINRAIKFAYDEQLGYLTACPTNIGTGMRASVMLFLPAITINGALREVMRIIARLGFTVRGVYGEGSEAEGYMYQVSNDVTLGVSEEEIIFQVDEVARKICQIEGAEREKLLHGRPELAVKDKCMRAYGIATNCAILSSGELTALAADIKLGACLGYFRIDTLEEVDSIVAAMRPCNITKLMGKAEFSAQERDKYRAEYVGKHIRELTKKYN